ncbi:succinyl-diaminopimelate desuccinylase [Wenxinia saemankumensis]|uniref:Succinyl-diaminopimelate desuccinylase n=1 Tax=Wenxinia saemankumensis TaxID=1447782 RepID=A0A1M6DZQ8_9RHOB|nr:succinyl-diaminopimelate desuccinylase [Wenxinia saemankumensis]SHI78737.1 succinyldiaminopimelate desuccinylase [Wenxinia saemankumensis]
MTDPVDPVDLTARLVRCPSVTPEDGGALDILRDLLEPAGFACTRVDRNGTPNLFARWGRAGANRTFGFNGHTDVVPVGDPADWSRDPFGGEIVDGILWGRGSVDMKSGVAAFAAAAVDFVRDTPPDGALVLAITGDEEGPGKDGTTALLDWMAEHGERMDHCLVGEPTCPDTFGEMMKIGRRGSLNAHVTVTGVQGHAAYPHLAKNPLPALARLCDRLCSAVLDEGTDHFDPSTLALVTMDVGNPATNVIPRQGRATVNIRYNDAHSGQSLSDWLRAQADEVAGDFGVEIAVRVSNSGESFVTPPGELSDLVAAAVRAETGLDPALSTTGGTSDARFVKDHCPVVEFGLVGRGMHAVDERVPVEDIRRLKAVYARILKDYFA